ncbi:MEMO1 family protein [Patescibacteria group bacterium]|nr:MEMO1 family protein [Patescibacteria group bacterium]
MLCFAGFVPHSPLLLESINTHRYGDVDSVVEALKSLAEDLYIAQPDVIVLFAESELMYDDAFCVNVADPYYASLEKFGDLGYEKTYHPDFGFIDAMQRHTRKQGQAISLTSDETLAFTATVPLALLASELPKVRIVPIAPCSLDLKTHFAFGQELREIISSTSKRVAVLAVGDMNHVAIDETEDGKQAETFAKLMKDILQEKNSIGLLNIPKDTIDSVKDASVRQLAMLFGVLEGRGVEADLRYFGHPLTVGWAVAEYRLA